MTLSLWKAKYCCIRGIYGACQLLRYAEGDIPTCSLKYLPRNDWLGKLRSLAISFMLFDVFLSCTRSSRVTYLSIHSFGVRWLMVFTVSESYLGVMQRRSAYQDTRRSALKFCSTRRMNSVKIDSARVCLRLSPCCTPYITWLIS